MIRRIVPILALSAASALLLSACASSSGSNSSASSTPTKAAVSNVSVSVGGVGNYSATLYLAQVEGYFTDQGLNVHITQGGNNTLNLVVAGQVDIGVVGATQAMGPVVNGKDTTLFYAPDTLGSFINAGVAKAYTNISQCKRVVTGGAGTSAYAAAALLKKVEHADFQIIPGANEGAIVATVDSGQADCVVGPQAYAAQGVAAGTLKLLIDSTKPKTVPAGVPSEGPGMGIWGLTDHVNSMKPAIVKFLKAMDEATAYMKKTDPATVAKDLRAKDAIDWGGIPEDALTDQIKAEVPFLGNGTVNKKEWPDWLSYAQLVYPTIDPSASLWSYSSRVNMSYLDNARK